MLTRVIDASKSISYYIYVSEKLLYVKQHYHGTSLWCSCELRIENAMLQKNYFRDGMPIVFLPPKTWTCGEPTMP